MLTSIRNGSRVIIDADSYKKLYNFRGELCDFLIFHEESSLVVSAIEFKGGSVEANKVIRQISNGFSVAEQVIGGYYTHLFSPIPILVRDRRQRLHPSETKMLGRARICFQAKEYRGIIVVPCGSSLNSIVRDYTPK